MVRETWWNLVAILSVLYFHVFMEFTTIQTGVYFVLRTKFHGLQYVNSYDDGLIVSGKHFRRVTDVDMKRDYAFVEFSDPRDADDARHYLDGRDVDGRRITVEFSRGVPRGAGRVREREYMGRGPAPGSGRCFNCGIDGHWARDCKAGDWKNKCYRCGERGHIERDCKNSPKKQLSRRDRSYSRTPVRSEDSPRHGKSRSRSYSRSRSPARRGRDVSEGRRSRSPTPRTESPEPEKVASASKSSRTPDIDSPRERSPKETSRSPVEDESPYAANGGNSPVEDRSPVEDDDDDDDGGGNGFYSP